MKAVISIIVVGILVSTSFFVMPEKNFYTQEKEIQFSKISFENKDGSIILKMKDANYDYSPGKPVLPVITKVFELPFGVIVKKIDVKLYGIKREKINEKIAPSLGPLPLIPYESNAKWFIDKSKSIYKSKSFYPKKHFSYKIGCGLNENGKRVTFVSLHIYPVKYAPALNEIEVAKEAKIKIEYTSPQKRLPSISKYQMVIISPPEFKEQAERLAEHKNKIGISTFVELTTDIYSNYSGRDEPEKIKYFIKNAIEQYGIKYVLLFGGLKSQIWGKARDNANAGEKGWWVPVRYTNLYDNPKYPLGEALHDPGFASDLYYADIYAANGSFSSWDSNHDGIFAAWNKPGVANDSIPDLYPDVYVGRLACRNLKEAKTVVDKIINYENNGGGDWFKKMVVVSGDGFLDQEDLNIKWDTKNLPNGEYTIYAQSINKYGKKGPIDVTHVKVDHEAKTKITFNQDDYKIPALKKGYPAPPIAKIVSVSNGNVLGKNDYHYVPSEREAYCNEFFHWANIDYENGVLTIRGKSYDPEPYGNLTSIHVWINDSNGNTVFQAWRNNTEMYYEGEWATGEKLLDGRGGALYYMPKDFQRIILWGSNGNFTGQQDVLNEFNKGCGFLFMSGHGSPNVWANHLPGIPGNRQHSSLLGLEVTSLKPWFPYIGFPLFPADSLRNGNKLPVVILGGCHNSMFNVSIIPAFLNAFSLITSWDNYMWTYGQPVPECLSWRLVRNPHGGSIASIGNTGLGYGMPGRACTTGGGDSWITVEFFRQYGAENHHILGQAYEMAIANYINSFDMNDMEAGHTKTVEQWELLGDPSLMIGGYS